MRNDSAINKIFENNVLVPNLDGAFYSNKKLNNAFNHTIPYNGFLMNSNKKQDVEESNWNINQIKLPNPFNIKPEKGKDKISPSSNPFVYGLQLKNENNGLTNIVNTNFNNCFGKLKQNFNQLSSTKHQIKNASNITSVVTLDDNYIQQQRNTNPTLINQMQGN